MTLKPLNSYTIALMMFFTFLILFFSGFIEFPSVTSSIPSPIKEGLTTTSATTTASSAPDPFVDLFSAFKKWDSEMGCDRFREKYKDLINLGNNSKSVGSLQEVGGGSDYSNYNNDLNEPLFLTSIPIP